MTFNRAYMQQEQGSGEAGVQHMVRARKGQRQNSREGTSLEHRPGIDPQQTIRSPKPCQK